MHAVNERLAHAWARRGAAFPIGARLGVAGLLLFGATEIAGCFGLVALIARGYRVIAVVLLAVYVLPLLTIGLARLRRLPETPSRHTTCPGSCSDFHKCPHPSSPRMGVRVPHILIQP